MGHKKVMINQKGQEITHTDREGSKHLTQEQGDYKIKQETSKPK